MARALYQCEATSVEGFVQQLAARYVNNGYRYYASGYVREGKDPREVDAKVIAKYRIDISKWDRHRRKRSGSANVQYLRYRQAFVILASGPHGKHSFFDGENEILDAREIPIKFSGYAISYTEARVWVRIDRPVLKNFRAYLLDIATKRTASELVEEFRALPFEPYRPVRYQLFRLLEEVNLKRRGAGGLALVPDRAVRQFRKICRPFEVEAKGGPDLVDPSREVA
jgi:hypothetical protein